MEINRKSWHYKTVKMWRKFESEIPADLCGYIQTLLNALGCIAVTAAMVIFLATLMGVASSVSVTGWIGYELPKVFAWWMYPLFTIIGIITIAGIIAGCFGAIAALVYIIEISKNADGSKSIVAKYLKDKSAKVCTRITFK